MGFLDDYEPVEDRLRAFWGDHPSGRVVTVLVGDTDGRYVVRAEVFRTDDALPAASGLAMERETDKGVNSTSALENCETSAIGRALANLGYAAKGKRASREEMSKASPAAGPHSGVATKGKGTPTVPSVDSSPAGDTSSAGVEAAGTDAGGGSQTLPGVTKYPVDPVDCVHRYATGAPAKVKVAGKELCRLCGMDWIAAVEGTTADLGAA